MKVIWTMQSENNQIFSKIMEDSEEPPEHDFQLAEGDFIVTAKKEYFVESFSITLFPAERRRAHDRDTIYKGYYFLLLSNNTNCDEHIYSQKSYNIDDAVKLIKYISTFKLDNAVKYFKSKKV